MTDDRPEWADDPDDDEAPTPDIDPEQDDEVPDDELDQVALTTTLDPNIESEDPDDREVQA